MTTSAGYPVPPECADALQAATASGQPIRCGVREYLFGYPVQVVDDVPPVGDITLGDPSEYIMPFTVTLEPMGRPEAGIQHLRFSDDVPEYLRQWARDAIAEALIGRVSVV